MKSAPELGLLAARGAGTGNGAIKHFSVRSAIRIWRIFADPIPKYFIGHCIINDITFVRNCGKCSSIVNGNLSLTGKSRFYAHRAYTHSCLPTSTSHPRCRLHALSAS
jgi:hypothetical protein